MMVEVPDFELLLPDPRLETFRKEAIRAPRNSRAPIELLSAGEMDLPYPERIDIAAARLYLWDSHVAASFWPSVSFVEVVLRNAMIDALCDYFRIDPDEDWYNLFQPGPPTKPLNWINHRRDQIFLTKKDFDLFDNELSRIRRRYRNPRPSGDMVVGKVSLGIWGMLLSDGSSAPGQGHLNYEQTLWEPCLSTAFPRFNGKRAALREKFRRFSALRNRIAHHEHLIGRELGKYIDLLEFLLDTVDGPAADFFLDANKIREAIDRKDEFLLGEIRL